MPHDADYTLGLAPIQGIRCRQWERGGWYPGEKSDACILQHGHVLVCRDPQKRIAPAAPPLGPRRTPP
eukprot:4336001-Pyramimonas_sp.AAC.1